MERARFDRVEVERVSLAYGPTRALAGVSATFTAGTVSTLEGPNGAGKSSLLNVLATLARPNAGVVRYGALELPDDRVAIRPAIGLVAHEALVYPDLSARESLELYARWYRIDAPRAAVERVIEAYALGTFVDKPARVLSRGQLQRVALARATVHEPTLLLFDEPTTGLDHASTERVAVAIDEAKKRGCIVVVVTHDRPLAERVADRRVFIARGKVERVEVIARPKEVSE
ncbi:MAG: ABC transporter ATP-binding protein [Myxococcales bacterium]|nr:ABC transporter ATP-binding protein [Myxococcales bacterium]